MEKGEDPVLTKKY